MSTMRTVLISVFGLMLVVWIAGNMSHPALPESGNVPYVLPYSDFLSLMQHEKLSQIDLSADSTVAYGLGKNGTKYQTTLMRNDPGLADDLIKSKAVITVMPPPASSTNGQGSAFLLGLLMNFGPAALIIGFSVYLMRRMSGSNLGGRGLGGMMNKSPATLVDPKSNAVRLSDVAGCDEAKQEVSEIIDFLKNPSRFKAIGAQIPRGVLMAGPPGTGKTLLAKAIAGEAGVSFLSASGSGFVEMFVGTGAARVRAMFEEARKMAPSILFIDEIDAVGRHRSGGGMGGNDEREQTLNQLLVEMDGFNTDKAQVIVLAATNRTDVLDKALRRPGRFDREVHVGLPDIQGRSKILDVHARKVALAKDVDLTTIARGTPGFSGADLANLVNEAALFAARSGKSMVSRLEFERAKDKILMGPERSSAIMPAKELKITAWHEAGHAIVARYLPLADPLHKVTIMPRGSALGVTMQLPTEDQHGYSKQELLTTIAVLLGGRGAEELFLSDVTTGASNDLERATAYAYAMVSTYGMSSLGLLSYTERRGSGFKGDGSGGSTPLSDVTQQKIDAEVARIVDQQYQVVKALLSAHQNDVKLVAEGLLNRETLDAKDLDALLGPRPTVENSQPITPTPPVVAVDDRVWDIDATDADQAPTWNPSLGMARTQ